MPRQSASSRFALVVVGFLALCAVVLAAVHPGVPAADLRLNDGGVWVTNPKKQMLAHFNYSAQTFDAVLRMATKQFDVSQDADDVVVQDQEASTLSAVDVVRSVLEPPVAYAELTPTVRGNVTALADQKGGKVWVHPTRSLAEFSPEKVAPVAQDMPGAVVQIGDDGTVYALSAQASLMVAIPADSADNSTKYSTVAELSTKEDIQLTSVGKDVVLFDPEAQILHLPGGQTIQIPNSSGGQLQDPSPADDHVLLATPDTLYAVALKDGQLTTTLAGETKGKPVRPVRVGSCAYAAWTGSGAFIRDCDDDQLDTKLTIDTLARASSTVFRVNRSVVVLNDVEAGTLWLPDNDMLLIDDWDRLISTVDSDGNDDQEDGAGNSTELKTPDRQETNTPPQAHDDEFGVRAGRTNTLPVLINDTDPDGDFLTVTEVENSPLGQVSITRGGAGLLVQLPEGASGSATLNYTINDGRGGTSQAKVTYTVHAPDVNSAPQQIAQPSVSLSVGKRSSINALEYWYDPDGDPIYLAHAQAVQGLNVRFLPSGTVDVSEDGFGVGKSAVALGVSDGREVGDGELLVTVTGPENLPPVTRTDHVVVYVGESATVNPLENDTDPNGDQLRLVNVDDLGNDLSTQIDPLQGTLTVSARTIGTYYVRYEVTDGEVSAAGYLRVDVLEQPANAQPLPEDDIAVLPEGGQVLIDLVGNDYDPAGGVLSVDSVSLPEGSPLEVGLIDHHIARVTAPGGLKETATFTYTVSNGQEKASASVSILPGAAQRRDEAPHAHDDFLVIRTGDVGSVRVLDNDMSPSGLRLSVASELQHDFSPDQATVFISGNVVRVRAGAQPASGTIVYSVVDSAGNSTTAQIHVTIVPVSEGENAAPQPRPVTARVSSGQRVALVIPLDGIDPDGDSVTLKGLATAPQLGSAEIQGNVVTYTAGAGVSGTDVFSYTVRDTLGKEGIGSIRIGVTPLLAVNQLPVPVPDEVFVRPQTRVALPVLSNDFDPDGDQILLREDDIATNNEGVKAVKRGTSIVLTAPQDPGPLVITYGIEDSKGGRARGIATVIVSPDAPEHPPIARDDTIVDEQIRQAQTSGYIDIDVTANDEDVDGDIARAKVTSTDSEVTVEAGNILRVRTQPKPRIVVYTLTDQQGLESSAVVRVPGFSAERPILTLNPGIVRLRAGESVDIPLNTYISSSSGRSVRLVSESSASAGAGHDGSNVVKDLRTLSFTSTAQFSGRTGVSVEVTEDHDTSPENRVTERFIIPIEVEATQNRAPSFRPNGLVLEREGPATTVNLAQAAVDPDEGETAQLSFTIVSDVPAGLNASVSGSTLSVQATSTAREGLVGAIRVQVTDPRGGQTVADIPVTVRVHGSTVDHPPVQTAPAQVTVRGNDIARVDLLRYVSTIKPGGKLEIVGQPTVTKGGNVSVNGTQLEISAQANYSGSFVVSYVVTDEAQNPQRHASGQVYVTVLSRPGAPVSVRAEALSLDRVRLSWATAQTGGSPITGFTITDHTQGDTHECPAVTSCVISGRTTGMAHRFSVHAINSVGASDESAIVTVELVAKPSRPNAPVVTAGDRIIDVKWNAVKNSPVPVQYYEIELIPGETRKLNETGAADYSMRFANLTNGKRYQARVRTVGQFGPSEWSILSANATPYGPPGEINGLRAAALENGSNSSANMTISWNHAHPNGRAIDHYRVTVGDTVHIVSGGNNALAIPGVPVSAGQVTVTVQAFNAQDERPGSASKPVSLSVWVLGKPQPPKITSVRATGNDAAVHVEWEKSVQGNGWMPSDLSYEWSTGAGWQPLNGNTLTGNGLRNGHASQVMIRAVGNKTGSPAYSDPATSPSVTPFGVPVPATISCRGLIGAVECTWSEGSGNGRPLTYRLTDAANETVKTSGTRSFEVPAGQTVRLCIQTVQAESQRNVEACDQATSQGQDRPRLDRGIGITVDGLTVTVFTENYRGATTQVNCWNAQRFDDRRSPVPDPLSPGKYTDPGNFLGQANSVQIPRTGIVTFTCSGNPINTNLQPNNDFSIHLAETNEWIRPSR